MLQYTLGGFMKEVYQFLSSLNIKDSDVLIVAVSYGSDSMALLDIIKKTYFKNKIVCAHVHHNHRKESDLEENHLREFCNINDVVFEFMKIESYKNDKFTEEEARKKRYDFFETLIKKYDSKYLFTAHHGDDLIETVLMRIIRGSTLKGYAGIELINKRSNYNLIRPLLFITKDDILSYCKENKISYAEDKTNTLDEYTRNRLRKYVLPHLKKENVHVHKKFLKFSNLLNEYDKYFTNLVDKLYDSIVSDNIIDLDELLKHENIIIKRIIMRYLYNNYGNEIAKISDENMDLVLSLINSDKKNATICLPNKKTLIKSYNKLYFDNDLKYNNYCVMFNGLVKLPNGFVIEQISELENTSNYVTAFNAKDLSFPLYVRGVICGDKIEILGLNGSKKIKDVFINEKIPKKERDNYPVVVDGNDKIIWLPGLKKSKYDRSKTGKYDIILKCYKEEKNDSTR